MEKGQFFKQMLKKLAYKKLKKLTFYIKIKPKWIIDLNVKLKKKTQKTHRRES